MSATGLVGSGQERDRHDLDWAWCVATEVDYAWTCVGGARQLIDRVLADRRLEVLPAKLTDQPFYDSDVLNAALDR